MGYKVPNNQVATATLLERIDPDYYQCCSALAPGPETDILHSDV